MAKLVRAIHSLEVLSLNCSVGIFPIDAIRKHGVGLRELCLRDYDDVVHWPRSQRAVIPLSPHDLVEIQCYCPNIMELTLDLDQGVMVRQSYTTSFIRSPSVSWKTDQKLCSHPLSQACL